MRRQPALLGSPERIKSPNNVGGRDAFWIRAPTNDQGAWANSPPKRNCKEAICFSPYLYRARNLVERFFNKTKQCRRVAPATTGSRPTILSSSSFYPYGSGYALMNPRPSSPASCSRRDRLRRRQNRNLIAQSRSNISAEP
jgi:transposase